MNDQIKAIYLREKGWIENASGQWWRAQPADVAPLADAFRTQVSADEMCLVVVLEAMSDRARSVVRSHVFAAVLQEAGEAMQDPESIAALSRALSEPAGREAIRGLVRAARELEASDG